MRTYRHYIARTTATAVLTAGALFAPLSGTAFAHQHLFNPSGTCPSEDAEVPQGLTNPAGNTPGDRNNAAGNEQGTANCTAPVT